MCQKVGGYGGTYLGITYFDAKPFFGLGVAYPVKRAYGPTSGLGLDTLLAEGVAG